MALSVSVIVTVSPSATVAVAGVMETDAPTCRASVAAETLALLPRPLPVRFLVHFAAGLPSAIKVPAAPVLPAR